MRKTWIVIFILTGISALSIGLWHRAEGRPSSMDETRHMRLAQDYAAFLFKGKPLLNEWSHVYPPLYHLSILPAVMTAHPNESRVAWVHLLYVLIFLLGGLLISRALNRSLWEWALASTLTLGYALILWEQRRALMDFPLLAWVTLTFGCLMATQKFQKRRESALFALVCGLGLLLKPPFIFFIAGPVLWAFWKTTPTQKRTGLGALAVAGAIGMLWYFWQWPYFLAKASGLATEKTYAGTDPRTWTGLTWYLRLLPVQMGLAGFGMTCIGWGALLWKRPSWERLLPFVAWALSGFLILTLLVNKDQRHTIPLLPALAWLSAAGWMALAQRPWAKFATVICAGLVLGWQAVTLDRPAREDWKINKIGAILRSTPLPDKGFYNVSVLSHHPRFFSRTLLWSWNGQGIPVQAVSPGSSDVSFVDFIVRRTGDQGTEVRELSRQWDEILPESEGFQKLFNIRAQYTLMDQSQVVVYAREPYRKSGPDVTPAQVEKALREVLSGFVSGSLRIRVTSSPGALSSGRMDRLSIQGEHLQVKNIPIDALGLEMENAWLNLDWLLTHHRVGLLAATRMTPHVVLSSDALLQALSGVKGLSRSTVEIRDGKVRAQSRFHGIPVGVVLRIYKEEELLVAQLDTLRVAGIPIPGWILGKAYRQVLPLTPTAGWPMTIELDRILCEDNRIQINP